MVKCLYLQRCLIIFVGQFAADAASFRHVGSESKNVNTLKQPAYVHREVKWEYMGDCRREESVCEQEMCMFQSASLARI